MNKMLRFLLFAFLISWVNAQSGNLRYMINFTGTGNSTVVDKVKKRLFKIKCTGDEVVVTEDHSIIVSRNNQLISCKPMDILKTDKVIKIT